jgi:pyruvate dehydrogenase E1 component beta subunit
MAKVTLIEAVTLALTHEMKNDPSVIVLGEDVGVNGGVFRATAGLQSQFGPDRVMDTPLAESMIAGLSVGMAAQGMRPVAEIQFMGFIYPTVDQMINHAGRLRHRTRGRLHCPMVLRAPFGGGIHAPEHHSEFLEPKRIYRLQKQEVVDDGKALPLDVCYTLREGDDVTLVTWGAMTFETLKAADNLAEKGISCEVIDVATVSPIDMETILESVEKTGRLVIVHEAARSCGIGAEIAATVAEEGVYDLEAPIRRVTGYDTVMPLFRMEYQYLPSVQRITDAVTGIFDE